MKFVQGVGLVARQFSVCVCVGARVNYPAYFRYHNLCERFSARVKVERAKYARRVMLNRKRSSNVMIAAAKFWLNR